MLLLYNSTARSKHTNPESTPAAFPPAKRRKKQAKVGVSNPEVTFERELMALEDVDVPAKPSSTVPRHDDIISLPDSVVCCFSHHGELIELNLHSSAVCLCNGCGHEGPGTELWTTCSSEKLDCGKIFCDSCDQRWINFQ